MTRWQGIVLTVIAVAATLWLAATGRLALYIHPRYVVFTAVMAVIAVGFAVAAIALRHRGRAEGGHDHDHEADDETDARPHRRGLRLLSAGASLTLALCAAGALLFVPPAVLTSATAADRSMNAGAPVLGDDELISVGGDYSAFTVKDWASLLAQVSSPEFFADKSVDVVGFVTADPADPENVYFVSRFIVTCCAVDAQPVGVPVHDPGWRSTLEENDWVHVVGPFTAAPDASSSTPVVVAPESAEIVDEPADPYVH